MVLVPSSHMMVLATSPSFLLDEQPPGTLSTCTFFILQHFEPILGERERLRLGRFDFSCCCSLWPHIQLQWGERTDATGTRLLVLLLRMVALSPASNGRKRTVATRTVRLVSMLLLVAAFSASNWRERTDATGMSSLLSLLLMVAISPMGERERLRLGPLYL